MRQYLRVKSKIGLAIVSFANFIPVIGIIFFGWNIIDLLLLYFVDAYFVVIENGLYIKNRGIRGSRNLSELRKYGDHENRNILFWKYVIRFTMIAFIALFIIISVAVTISYSFNPILLLSMCGLVVSNIIIYQKEKLSWMKHEQLSMKELHIKGLKKISVFFIMISLIPIIGLFVENEMVIRLFDSQGILEIMVIISFVIAKLFLEMVNYTNAEKSL